MTRQEFIDSAERILQKYCAADMAFSDNTMLAVIPDSLSLSLVDDEEADGDLYDVQEFLAMHPGEEYAGNWIVDADALEALADEYFPAENN